MNIQDIEKDLIKCNDILIFSRQLIYDSYHMLMTNKNEKFTIILRDKFLNRVRDPFRILATIELSKLFENKNKCFSIVCLIKILEEEYEQSDWKNMISLYELKQIKFKLNAEDTKKQIKNLKEIRDQHYAHSDKTPENNIYDIALYYEDYFSIINKSELILQTLFNKLLDKSISPSIYKGDDTDIFFEKYLDLIQKGGLYDLSLK